MSNTFSKFLSLISVRPEEILKGVYQCYNGQWIRRPQKPPPIVEQVAVFEQDLCQLVENLKELVFIDIYGRIDPEKLEPYRSMIKKRFPNSRLHIEQSKFRLWI